MFFAWVSDRYRQRAAVIAVQACITLVGLLVTGFARPAAWRYAGLENFISVLVDLEKLIAFLGIFLTNAGSGGCIPGILAYVSFNSYDFFMTRYNLNLIKF